MIAKTLTVLHEEGLHTRPANEFVRIVKAHQAAVMLRKADREASGSSLLKIMKLGIVTGDEITLTCDGSDEEATMEALVRLVRPNGAS